MNLKRSEMMKARWADPAFRERMCATMRSKWRDPAWAERTTAAITEGVIAASRNRPFDGQAKGARYQKRGDKRGILVYLDADTFKDVRSIAVKQRKPVSEVIRTYVEWGLEEEGQAA